MTDPYKQADRERWLRDLLCGALIGAGAILPGVSGGVLALVFDVYRPMMETLAHPGRGIRKYWHIFLPLGIGWAVGFLGLAKGDQRRVCSVGRRYHLALYRPYCRNVSCSLAGGGKGGPWPGGVDRLRRLRPVSVSVAFLCAPCASRVGDAELWLVQLLRRALGRQRGAAGADQLLHYDGVWAV